ncbi:MAG: AAA family ATPase, partial [Bacteroidales bacterium]
ADLIIIDAFADVFNGQLYETNRVRAFLNEYSQLAQRHQCLVIFLHHTNKRSDNLEPSKHNALGSQGFEAKMRLMIELKSDTQSANKKYFCIVKGNYLSHKFKTHAYDLQFTENMTFKNLETRTHYELLTQKSETREVVEAEYKDIKELKDKGRTLEEIGLDLGVSRATIARKISRFKKLEALENSK